MLGFVQRAAGRAHESLVVRMTTAPDPFCNVGTDAVSRPDDLLANSIFRKRLPTRYDTPDFVSQPF
jgi:hypothetical protein